MFYHWVTHISANTNISYIQVNLKIRILLILEGLLHTLIFSSILTQMDDFTRKSMKIELFQLPNSQNFPFLSSNLLSAPLYGVYVSQWKRYAHACSHYPDFIYRNVLLTQKLLEQSYEKDRLKMTLRKFYGHHHQLVEPYDVSLSKLT